jgi:hypothetical protein
MPVMNRLLRDLSCRLLEGDEARQLGKQLCSASLLPRLELACDNKDLMSCLQNMYNYVTSSLLVLALHCMQVLPFLLQATAHAHA